MIRLAPNAQGWRGKDEKADPSEGFRKWPAEEEAGRQTVLIKSVMSWGLGAKNAALLKTNCVQFNSVCESILKEFHAKTETLWQFGLGFFCSPKVLILQVINNWKWEISKYFYPQHIWVVFIYHFGWYFCFFTIQSSDTAPVVLLWDKFVVIAGRFLLLFFFFWLKRWCPPGASQYICFNHQVHCDKATMRFAKVIVWWCKINIRIQNRSGSSTCPKGFLVFWQFFFEYLSDVFGYYVTCDGELRRLYVLKGEIRRTLNVWKGNRPRQKKKSHFQDMMWKNISHVVRLCCVALKAFVYWQQNDEF